MSAAHSPEQKPEAGADGGGSHEKGGKSLLSYPVNAVTTLGKGIWGTLGFFGRRVRAVLSDAWGATGGNAIETATDIGKAVTSPTSKEANDLGERIPGIMGWARKQIIHAGAKLGTIAGTVAGAPLAIGQRGFVSVAHLPKAVWSGKSKKEKHSAAHDGAEEHGGGDHGKPEHH